METLKLSKEELSKKRKADFFTGLLILFISIAMLFESFTFPMTDSYGGVQNVWYVSPALLPILVSSLLILLSLILIKRSITDGGFKQAIEDFPKLTQTIRSEGSRRFFIICCYLIAYVYGVIPYVDFFIGSMVFLLAFILPFYLDRSELFSVSFLPFMVTSTLIGILGYQGMVSSLLADIALLAIMLFITLCSYLKIKGDSELFSKWRISVMTSVLTPLILVPCFKFGLLVPLPTEGLVIKAMEHLAYLVR